MNTSFSPLKDEQQNYLSPEIKFNWENKNVKGKPKVKPKKKLKETRRPSVRIEVLQGLADILNEQVPEAIAKVYKQPY